MTKTNSSNNRYLALLTAGKLSEAGQWYYPYLCLQISCGVSVGF
jgi:hypothetical protein